MSSELRFKIFQREWKDFKRALRGSPIQLVHFIRLEGRGGGRGTSFNIRGTGTTRNSLVDQGRISEPRLLGLVIPFK